MNVNGVRHEQMIIGPTGTYQLDAGVHKLNSEERVNLKCMDILPRAHPIKAPAYCCYPPDIRSPRVES